MHTTACASERNWSKLDLMFANDRAKLSVEHASQMIFLSENHVFTDFSEAEMLDLPLEDDDKMLRDVSLPLRRNFGIYPIWKRFDCYARGAEAPPNTTETRFWLIL